MGRSSAYGHGHGGYTKPVNGPILTQTAQKVEHADKKSVYILIITI